MTEAAAKLLPLLDALTFGDRECLREYLACHEEVQAPQDAFSEPAKKLIEQLFDLDWEEQLAVADLLRQANSCPPGVLSENDPNFEAIINERLRQLETGEDPGVPSEEMFRRLREKYG